MRAGIRSAAKIRLDFGHSKSKGTLDLAAQLLLVKIRRLVIGFMAGDLESGLGADTALILLESGQALKLGDAVRVRRSAPLATMGRACLERNFQLSSLAAA